MPKLKFLIFFVIVLRSKSWISIFVVEFKPWLNYLSSCPRIIFECKVIVWGWDPVRFTNHQLTGLLLCAFDIACHYGTVSSGILNCAPQYPCHSTCGINLNTIELNKHFLHKVPRAIFFKLGPKILVQAKAKCSAWMHSDHYYGLRIS